MHSFAADRDAVLARARAAGVSRMVTIGASGTMQANYDAVALAGSNVDVFATVGVHPHAARSASPEVIGEMARLAREPKVVAIGETGLDYYYDNSPRPVQQDVFRQLIALARGLRLPLVIHVREAYEEVAAILRAEKAADVGGVIHCFSAGLNAARAFLDIGFDLSFSGIVTFKHADDIRAAARMVPADRFMVETDAPFLAPMPHRGKRNEPVYVLFTAAAIAAARQQSLKDIATLSRQNTERRFRLPQR